MHTILKTQLEGTGFNVVALPKTGIDPLLLLYQNNGELTSAGGSLQTLFPIGDAAPPQVKRNAMVPAMQDKSTVQYDFDLGVSVLDGLLTKLKLGKLGIGGGLHQDKTVSISYENILTDEVDLLHLDNYLNSSSPTREKFYTFREKLENSEMYVLTATLKSDSFTATIAKKNSQELELDATVKAILDANVDWKRNKDHSVSLTHKKETPVIFAFKAYQILYDKKKWWEFGRTEEVIFRIKESQNTIFKSEEGFPARQLDLGNRAADI